MVASAARLPPVPDVAVGVPYEQRLREDWGFAMSEGSRHFGENSEVFAAMRAVADRLNELGIPYAVVGGLAAFRYGLPRFTEDVDLLVTAEGHEEIKGNLRGRGYLPPFEGSKNLRDTVRNVRIEFLITGNYPGDGKAKPVAFPDPADVGTEIDGVRYVRLETFLELKLASGMTAPDRPKDLGDVTEMIRTRRLPRDLGERLNPFVRDEYERLWDAVEASRIRE